MFNEGNLYIVDAEYVDTASSLDDSRDAIVGAIGQIYNSLEYLCQYEQGAYIETIKAKVLPKLLDLYNSVDGHTDMLQSEVGMFLDQIDADDKSLYGG
jgi:hypothetical protein